MVSFGVSKLDYISLIFNNPGVMANRAGGYYFDLLLSQQLLRAIRPLSGKFISQQNSVPACQFSDVNILHVVQCRVSYGGIFSHRFIANFPLSKPVSGL